MRINHGRCCLFCLSSFNLPVVPLLEFVDSARSPSYHTYPFHLIISPRRPPSLFCCFVQLYFQNYLGVSRRLESRRLNHSNNKEWNTPTILNRWAENSSWGCLCLQEIWINHGRCCLFWLHLIYLVLLLEFVDLRHTCHTSRRVEPLGRPTSESSWLEELELVSYNSSSLSSFFMFCCHLLSKVPRNLYPVQERSRRSNTGRRGGGNGRAGNNPRGNQNIFQYDPFGRDQGMTMHKANNRWLQEHHGAANGEIYLGTYIQTIALQTLKAEEEFRIQTTSEDTHTHTHQIVRHRPIN